MRYLIVLSVLLVPAATLLACRSGRRTTHFPTMRGEAVAFVEIPSDVYPQLEPDVLAGLWPTIHRFLVEPGGITLDVGRDYPLHAVRVIGVDSLGNPVGQIARLEYSLMSDAARLTDRETLHGVKVGDAVLVVRPRLTPSLQNLTPLPEWRVAVRVR